MDKGCENINTDLAQLSDLLHNSKYAVVLTGAGMSTESGVPDFRSKEGWWNKINPATVASTSALEHNYDLFRDFYQYRIKALSQCKPNTGHKILAEWEAKGLIKCVITQNVDGFHKAAGSKNVYELHGSINSIRCDSCGKETDVQNFMDNADCPVCKGKLRPGVVLFGESLPEDAWSKAIEEIRKADLIIVIGSSLTVSPVNHLPFITKGKKVLINLDNTDLDSEFDLIIHGKAADTLNKLNGIMKTD